jgi:hypothetical protein
VEEAGNFPFTCTMYAQRFDGQGNVSGTFGVSIKNISVFFFPEPIPDGQDGFYLAFTTSNPDNASLSDVYMQRMRSDFSTWSATGTELMTGTSTQRFTGGLALLNDIMGLMAPVSVTSLDQSQGGWSVQRLDTAGVPQLGPSGVEMVSMSAFAATPDGVAGTVDGCIVVYSEGGFGQEHLKAARLGVAGNLVWGPGVIDLCTANSNKDDLGCGELGNDGQLVSVWQDDRLGSGIYAQNITLEGDLGTGIAALTGSAEHLLAIPVESGTVEVVTPAPWPSGGLLRLLDATGRLVRTERMSATRTRITLPAPGAYIAELTGPERTLRTRFVAP